MKIKPIIITLCALAVITPASAYICRHPTSPVMHITPDMAKAGRKVIEENVRQFYFSKRTDKEWTEFIEKIFCAVHEAEPPEKNYINPDKK